MNIKLTLTLLFYSCYCLITNAQSIRINEVVSSNSTYMDEDGDTPDWLELHNFGATAVSLLNWGLTDDIDDLHSWQFPDITMNPDEYILVWASDKDRKELSFVKTLVNRGDIYNYLVPSSEPNPNWKENNFNDSSWDSGPSGFGYGDDDDATEIPEGSNSVYARISFTMGDLANLNELILDIDYDDAFVAYINGVEVARNNIDGNPPAFDENANEVYDANIIIGDSPERFLIENATNLLIEGENVLAIQLHNINPDSSDLTLIPFLSAIFSEDITIGITPPEILNLRDGKLHTNFKVSSSSEDLYLSDPNQNIIDHVLVESLVADTSFGISVTSGNLVNYIDTTPGAVNSNVEFTGAIGSTPVFSHEGGLVSGSVNLVLSGNSAGEIIRYTTDATIPTADDTAYVTPILIDASTVVRARIFSANKIPSDTYTKSFVFNSSHELDVIFLTTEPENFFDEDTGIYAFGPDGSYDTNSPFDGANFHEDWERPIHFVYYPSDSNAPVIEYNAGVKIFGGYSRAHDQKSLSLFARGKYGASEFEHPFFDELAYDQFQSIVLRNSGNDWLSSNIKDISLTSLMRGSGLDFQEHNSVAAYLNGEYWGMYNMREKNNEHMLASKHNIDADDITMLEKNSEVIEGSNEEYVQLIDYVSSTDLSIDANFEYVSDRVDITNYALYQLTNIFFNNTDWPGNNIKYWKHPKGKWRWILFDTDFGFGPPWNTTNYDENTLEFALEEGRSSWPNPDWATLLFRNLITNINFRNTFVNRYADELNSRFLSENVKIHIDTVYESVASEIPAHFERWDGSDNTQFFVDEMKDFADARPEFAKDHILSTFDLPSIQQITIANNDTSLGSVRVNNNLEIQEATWTGDYFETVPIKLTAVAEAGYKFSHWSGDIDSTDLTIELSLTSSTSVTPNFVETIDIAIVINEINYKSGDDLDTDDWVELYNPNDHPIDISNWQLKDDKDSNIFNIPVGTIIEANGYVVLVKSNEDFSSVFPNVNNVIGNISFGFGSEDAVRLYNDDGILQDEVVYDSLWPACADGTGQTLELNDAESDNSLPENWSCINTKGSPNSDNNDFILGVDEISLDNILLYPNPVSSILNIKGMPKIESFRVFDVAGRLVLNEKVNNPSSINLSNLRSGVYLLHLQVKNSVISKEIIKL